MHQKASVGNIGWRFIKVFCHCYAWVRKGLCAGDQTASACKWQPMSALLATTDMPSWWGQLWAGLFGWAYTKKDMAAARWWSAVVVQQNGTKVGVSGKALKVIDKEGTTLQEIPLVNIESLSLLVPFRFLRKRFIRLLTEEFPLRIFHLPADWWLW